MSIDSLKVDVLWEGEDFDLVLQLLFELSDLRQRLALQVGTIPVFPTLCLTRCSCAYMLPL
jgi:hypothetical protein